jgi:penicillin-binding protein 2
MIGVVLRGTGTLAKVPGITVAGKTGTAQNPHGKDHAWFIAFAPVENPKIAMAVLVENAGFGGSISAPIARELIKYYLQGREMPGSSPQKGGKSSDTPGPAAESSSDNDLPVIEAEKPLNTPEPASGAALENNSGKQQQNDL